MRGLPINPETCPRCYVGRIRQKNITLSLMVSEHLVSVPGFPIWSCDVCHASMYDPKAVISLNQMLAASGQKKINRRKSRLPKPSSQLEKPAKPSA